MNVISLDIPILIAGLLVLIYAKIFLSKNYFQILCQFVGTFAAQYSFGVSWSLGKLVPILSAVNLNSLKPAGLKLYLPFVIYTFISSLICCLFWDIPQGVNFWYGDARVYLQLISFLSLVLSTLGLATAISEKNGTRLLILFLQFAAIIHGIASVYQLIANGLGLPLIGIGRAHGLTMDNDAGDVAAFVAENGMEIFRPGGLMGEPKTAAVLFGVMLLHGIFVGVEPGSSKKMRIVGILSLVLSAAGFLLAFSTSCFAGFAVLLVFFLFALVSRSERLFSVFKIAAAMFFMVGVWFLLTNASIDSLIDIFTQRTVGRLDGTMDPPVEASINKLLSNPFVAIFGVGQGGSSFVVMEFLGTSFDYAYAPNIGMILLLIESGILGTLLFLGVFIKQSMAILKNIDDHASLENKSLFVIGISSMVMCLTGSGIALGFPLAIACISVASYKASALDEPNLGYF